MDTKTQFAVPFPTLSALVDLCCCSQAARIMRLLGGVALVGSEGRGWDFFGCIRSILLLLVSPESPNIPFSLLK